MPSEQRRTRRRPESARPTVLHTAKVRRVLGCHSPSSYNLFTMMLSGFTSHARPYGELSGRVPPGNARHAMSKRKRRNQADLATFAIGSLREDAVAPVIAVSSLGFTLLVAVISYLCTRRDPMTARNAHGVGARSLTG